MKLIKFFSSVSFLLLMIGLQGCTMTPAETATVVVAYKLYDEQNKTTYYQPDYYQTRHLNQKKLSRSGQTYHVENLRCQQTQSACDNPTQKSGYERFKNMLGL